MTKQPKNGQLKGVNLPKIPCDLIHRIQIELARRQITWSEFATRAFEKELKAKVVE